MAIDRFTPDNFSASQIREPLEKSDQFYHTMFENMNSGVAVYESLDEGADFRFIEFNLAAERIDQICRDQVIGRKLLEVFPDAGQVGLVGCLQRVAKTGNAEDYQSFHYANDPPHGGWRKNFVYRLPSGELVVIYEDITDRVNAEEALRLSEERWKFALDGAGEGVWDWNIQTGKVFFSKQWKSMLGYDETEIGNTLPEWESRVNPADLESVSLKLQDYFRGETESYESEHRLRCKDGSYKWILDRGKVISWASDGQPLRMLGTHSDISDRKQLEEDLRVSQEKFSKAFMLCPDAISITRLRDGLFIMANHGVERTLGYTEKEIIGKTIKELNTWDDPHDRDRLLTRLMGEGRVENFEACYRTKSGEARYGLLSSAIISLGGEDHILNVTRDITEMKQTTDELQKAIQLANHLRKKAEDATQAKSEFLANMSHEFRTPLNSIIGFSQILVNESVGLLSFKQKAYVKEIHEAGHHLLQLIDDILDIAKAESGKITLRPGCVNLNELIRKTVALLYDAAEEKNIKLDCVIAPEFHRKDIEADGLRLKQVLMNLLSNAIKFTPSGGSICIEARNDDHQVIVSVADTGKGILPDDRERIFRKFEQINPSRTIGESGAGLGLSVARMLAQLHGGDIWVQSEGENRGSLFIFTIPLIWSMEQTHDTSSNIFPDRNFVQASGRSTYPPEGERPTILVVEDNSANMILVTSLLEIKGYNWIEASSAEQALNILKKERPTLILMDISLPGMGGMEATQLIKSDPVTSNIPVIALSAHAGSDDQEKALEVGCEAYLTKPVDVDKFFDTLSSLFNA